MGACRGDVDGQLVKCEWEERDRAGLGTFLTVRSCVTFTLQH